MTTATGSSTADAVFDSLLLFRDNGNGVTEPGELLSLPRLNRLDQPRLRGSGQTYAGGNRITQIASFAHADGSRGVAATHC